MVRAISVTVRASWSVIIPPSQRENRQKPDECFEAGNTEFRLAYLATIADPAEAQRRLGVTLYLGAAGDPVEIAGMRRQR
jgi:hypothetical protein